MTSPDILPIVIDRFEDDGKCLRVRRQYNSNVTVGSVAGEKHRRDGYRRVQINGRKYQAHRVLWLMRYGKWPDGEIDHIDGDPENNAADNLRDVPHRQNSRNRKRQTNNTSGYPGVYFEDNAWNATIKVDGKRISLGRFHLKRSAIWARKEAEREHGYTTRGGE